MKLKTKSGAKKRFRLTASGKVRMGAAFKRHRLRNRSSDMKRSARNSETMSSRDAGFVKKYFLPYGGR